MEATENPVPLIRLEADACVCDGEPNVVVSTILDVQPDLTRRREFQRIADQIGQDLADTHHIAMNQPLRFRANSDRERDALLLGHRSPQGGGLTHDVRQMERCRLNRDLAGLDLGGVEDVRQQAFERVTGGADDIDHLAFARTQLTSGQGVGHGNHPVQGVRISWLILARKSLLDRLASSAA